MCAANGEKHKNFNCFPSLEFCFETLGMLSFLESDFNDINAYNMYVYLRILWIAIPVETRYIRKKNSRSVTSFDQCVEPATQVQD